jgi:hypothetical protein
MFWALKLSFVVDILAFLTFSLGNFLTLLKQKIVQKSPFLGYFILSKNHNEPPKVAQLAKNRPILSPWFRSML